MSKSVWFKIAVVAFVLTLTLSAFASTGTAKVTVPTGVQVNGQQIAAGDYKLAWTGDDAKLQVTFKNGKKEVATASAKLVERPNSSAYTSVVHENGSLKEVRFQGKKFVLVFNE